MADKKKNVTSTKKAPVKNDKNKKDNKTNYSKSWIYHTVSPDIIHTPCKTCNCWHNK